MGRVVLEASETDLLVCPDPRSESLGQTLYGSDRGKGVMVQGIGSWLEMEIVEA